MYYYFLLLSSMKEDKFHLRIAIFITSPFRFVYTYTVIIPFFLARFSSKTIQHIEFILIKN